MKKIFFVLAIFFIGIVEAAADGYFIGDGGSGKRVLVLAATMENGRKDDEWISRKVKRDFIADIVNYSNIDVIDSEEKATLLKLQKDSESTFYSDENPIELGKAMQAKSYIKLVITRKKDTFSLTATVTNIETTRTEGSSKSEFYSENDFISKAHGEVAAAILEALGVNLTAAGKRLLQYGSFTETASESAENLEVYKAEIARLEAEQADLLKNRSTEVDAKAESARLEVQKATLLQQKKNEEERLARLREDEKRKKEEEAAAKERDAESQKKIVALSNEIEQKAAKIRQTKTENMSVLQRIDVIEGEKQVLLANEQSIESNIAAYEAEQDDLYKKEVAERKRQTPHKAELTANSTLNETGRARLDSDLEAIRLKYEQNKEKNKQQLKASAGMLQEQLRQKILDDISSMEAEKFKADSLQNADLYFRVGEYDGDKKGWSYVFAFNFAGMSIMQDIGILTYKEITGLDVPIYPAANDPKRAAKVKAYEEYLANMEAYDAFFRLNVPYIRAILTYSVRSRDMKFASEYLVSVEKIEFFNMQSSTMIKQNKLESQSKVYTYYPKTDVNYNLENMRIKQAKEQEAELKRQQKEQEAELKRRQKEQEAELKRRQKEQEAEWQMSENDWAYQGEGNGGMTGFGLNVGKLDDATIIEGYLNISCTPWLFIDISGFGTPNEYDLLEGSSDERWFLGGGFSLGLGVNGRFHIGIFHPNLYYMLKGTAVMISPEEDIINEGLAYTATPSESSGDSGCAGFSHTFGATLFDIAMFDGYSTLSLDTRYTLLHFYNDAKLKHIFTAGVKITFPRAVISSNLN